MCACLAFAAAEQQMVWSITVCLPAQGGIFGGGFPPRVGVVLPTSTNVALRDMVWWA